MIDISLLSDIKFFLKKFFKNPVVVTALAYSIYVLMTRYIKRESFAESIKVIEKKGNKSLIYDDKLKKYILVDHDGNGIYSDNNPDDLRKML